MADGVVRSLLGAPIINTSNGGMILSEDAATSNLLVGDNVSIASFTGGAGI